MSAPVNPMSRITRFYQKKLYITSNRKSGVGAVAPTSFLKQSDTTSFILAADGVTKLFKAEP